MTTFTEFLAGFFMKFFELFHQKKKKFNNACNAVEILLVELRSSIYQI